MGLLGTKVDAIDYYTAEIEKLSEQVSCATSVSIFCSDFIIHSFTRPYNALTYRCVERSRI